MFESARSIAKGSRVPIECIITFARAFLQFVQAFGVIAPGARRFRAGGAGILLISSLPFDEMESVLWVRGVDGGGVIAADGCVGLRPLLSMVRCEMSLGMLRGSRPNLVGSWSRLSFNAQRGE